MADRSRINFAITQGSFPIIYKKLDCFFCLLNSKAATYGKNLKGECMSSIHIETNYRVENKVFL